ncbi:MAG: hypothetical protein HY466_03165 [Deltaproteobacteria bacterium]|nr:hypothetical protein [Deltaproteobacteria bacterium]
MADASLYIIGRREAKVVFIRRQHFDTPRRNFDGFIPLGARFLGRIIVAEPNLLKFKEKKMVVHPHSNGTENAELGGWLFEHKEAL